MFMQDSQIHTHLLFQSHLGGGGLGLGGGGLGGLQAQSLIMENTSL